MLFKLCGQCWFSHLETIGVDSAVWRLLVLFQPSGDCWCCFSCLETVGVVSVVWRLLVLFQLSEDCWCCFSCLETVGVVSVVWRLLVLFQLSGDCWCCFSCLLWLLVLFQLSAVTESDLQFLYRLGRECTQDDVRANAIRIVSIVGQVLARQTTPHPLLKVSQGRRNV